MWLQRFFFRFNNYQVIKNITTTSKETTTGKGPSSCESTPNEIKAYEVQASPKRLVAVATTCKLLVELLEDHSFSQVLCRTAKASCFQRIYSVHVQLEPCGGNVSPSVIQRLHIRKYPVLRCNYKLYWWSELLCIYKFLHSAVWLQRLLQAQQLSVFVKHYDDDKRDDERQRHCGVEHLKPPASREAKDRNVSFSQVVAKALPTRLKLTKTKLHPSVL